MREKVYYKEILLKHGLKKYNSYKDGFLKKVLKNIIISDNQINLKVSEERSLRIIVCVMPLLAKNQFNLCNNYYYTQNVIRCLILVKSELKRVRNICCII